MKMFGEEALASLKAELQTNINDQIQALLAPQMERMKTDMRRNFAVQLQQTCTGVVERNSAFKGNLICAGLISLILFLGTLAADIAVKVRGSLPWHINVHPHIYISLHAAGCPR